MATGIGPNKCADRGCRQEPNDQRRRQPHGGNVGTQQTGHARREQPPVVHDHRQNGAELNHDIEGLGAFTRLTQNLADQNQMTGRRDRQVLGQAFHDTQQNRDQ
jgi:hypothetical protein